LSLVVTHETSKWHQKYIFLLGSDELTLAVWWSRMARGPRVSSGTTTYLSTGAIQFEAGEPPDRAENELA
jgi:hypothetical protein